MVLAGTRGEVSRFLQVALIEFDYDKIIGVLEGPGASTGQFVANHRVLSFAEVVAVRPDLVLVVDDPPAVLREQVAQASSLPASPVLDAQLVSLFPRLDPFPKTVATRDQKNAASLPPG